MGSPEETVMETAGDVKKGRKLASWQ